MNPKIRVTIGEGRRGILLENLGNISKETAKFLEDLGEDLAVQGGHDWVADNFANGSVEFDLENPSVAETDADLWRRGLRNVMARDLSDDLMNVRIKQRTRQQFLQIAQALPPADKIQFALYPNGDASDAEVFELNPEVAVQLTSERPQNYRYHGDIQGIVHSFYKETKRPSLVVRELSTRDLVHCYFTHEMYRDAVEVLQDENAVVTVEGFVTEDSNNGKVTEMEVSHFTQCPRFDVEAFEGMIGRFPKALTGGEDAAKLLDDFRDE
jgi:hypothetical protein